MELSNEEKNSVGRMMYGTWSAEGKGEEAGAPIIKYDLIIRRDVTRFTVKRGNEVVSDDTFETSGMHWFGNFLYYTGTGRFFITNANENHIEFGELGATKQFDGKYEFHMRLKRVQ